METANLQCVVCPTVKQEDSVEEVSLHFIGLSVISYSNNVNYVVCEETMWIMTRDQSEWLYTLSG